MPEIIPFRGYQYNPKIFDDLSDVIAPPYDVISPQKREELLHRSTFNIVNLTLAETVAGKPDPQHYSNAANTLQQWKENNILLPVDRPSIWRVTESFRDTNDNILQRHGFITLLKLEEFSTHGIRRHERTHKAAKEDRYHLLDTTHMNFSPIFFIFENNGLLCEDLLEHFPVEETQCGQLYGETEVDLRIEQTSDSVWINSFRSILAEQPILIADGHHRYETALAFHKDHSDHVSLKSDYIMAYLVASSCQGLRVLPTHRGIHGLSSEKTHRLVTGLETLFTKEVPNSSRTYLSVSFRDDKVTRYYSRNGSDANLLDVQLFEDKILREILKLTTDEIANKKHLMYFHQRDECLKAVNDGELQVAFIMQPMSIMDLMSTTRDGRVLPQKSTFFFPKVGAGMVMQSLELI
ncbi:MAG: DUF1015 family protein [Fidelibacterota bacterium]